MWSGPLCGCRESNPGFLVPEKTALLTAGWLLPHIGWVLRLTGRLSSEDLPCPALQAQLRGGGWGPPFDFWPNALPGPGFLLGFCPLLFLRNQVAAGCSVLPPLLIRLSIGIRAGPTSSATAFNSSATPLLREVRGYARISIPE